MTYPGVELKFSQIQRTAVGTTLLVRLYRLDDGGLGSQGDPVNLRTLLRERLITVAAGVTKSQILSLARQKLQDWAIEDGYDLTVDRLLCSL
jgi:hypothetical protein